MCDPVRLQVQAQSQVSALISSAHWQGLDVLPGEALQGQAGTGPLRNPNSVPYPARILGSLGH